MATKYPKPSTIRWRPADQKLIDALSKKLGVKSSELVRMGLRALATKEGVTA